MLKHMYVSLLLLNTFHLQSFSPRAMMLDMMRDMEESFSRMHRMMKECYTDSPESDATTRFAGISTHFQRDTDSVTLTIKHVPEGTVDASFDRNTLHIKHPEFSVHIRQLKDRFDRSGLSVLMQAQQVTTKNETQNMKHAAYSSSSEYVTLEKSVQLDEPEITYDEATKELTVTLRHKAEKTIPVLIKK